ncbi:MAG: AMP-binding protein [Flavobacteriales bacterium]|nr:AMP-binding protein [Flavobacteriales bacterium]
MNPFLAYSGIQLNGKFISKGELKSVSPKDEFEGQIINYCQELFDGSSEAEIHTSGSTGKKKTILFQKSSLIQSAEATNSYFGLSAETKALLSLPIDYVAGKLMVVRAIVGEYNLITKKPESNPIKDLDQPIDFAPFTPHQVQAIIDESSSYLNTIKTVLLGGSPITKELLDQIQDTDTIFYEGFGMAETLTHVGIRKISDSKESLFQPMNDVILGLDSRGCLIIDRPGITKGKLVTNDIVTLDSEGFKWIGRVDNLINSGGIKIIPEEIEKILHSQLTSNFFVAGIPDQNFGEIACLFIEGEEEIDVERIEFESTYHKPKRIVHVKEFCYTHSGKIKRRETISRALSSVG